MTRAWIARQSFVDFGTRRLEALAVAAGLSHRRAEAAALFERLMRPWGHLPIGETPRWASDITDDHTPIELSLALQESEPELRMLVEAQAPEPSVAANWHAAWALSEDLEREYGVPLDRLRRVRDLFEPRNDPWARFSMWHAACVRREGAPDFKAYLNPQIQGPERAPLVAKEAFGRLGLSGAWGSIERILSTLDELKYFSLDLSSRKEARVKVYLAHRHVTANRLEAVMRTTPGHVAGDAAAFCQAMGRSAGPFSGMPMYTCLAFVEGVRRPSAVTAYFPIRSYVADDRVACDRILSLLPERDRRVYVNALQAAATRPLAEGIGMQTYVTFRRQRGERRVTVYFAPEAYELKKPAVREEPAALSQVPASGVRSLSSRRAGAARAPQRKAG